MHHKGDQFDLTKASLCVIRNKGSGRGDDSSSGIIRETLEPHVAGFEIRETDQGRLLPEVASEAVRDGFDVIVAAGGDGTQSAVAGAVTGTDAIMGVLPGGTFNYFARDLGVGETMEDALETLLNSKVKTVDVGQIENLVFLNNVSLGAYPHILKTREGIYERWGRSRIAAYWSVLVALGRMRHPLHLTTIVDGEERHFETALAFIARSAYQLENFGLPGVEAAKAGNLAVLIAREHRPLPLMRSALRLAVGQSAEDSDFDLIVTDKLSIETSKGQQLVAHDGEKTQMASPFHIHVRHDDLKVLVPIQPKEDAG